MRTGWESGRRVPEGGEETERSSCEELGECAGWNAFSMGLGCRGLGGGEGGGGGFDTQHLARWFPVILLIGKLSP